jgi:glycosyltransferase involved in cell wall biosynthesis
MKISIVTPSFNQGAYIRRTIDSVLSQRGDFELEYRVIDGGSTDDTLDILKSYGDRVAWISERDNGQVDAIKGTVGGLDGERVLAKKVRGRDIFRFGPAAGEDVVGPDERFSTDENAGSLYAFGPRDRTFATTVLAKTVRAVARLDTPSFERTTRVALGEGKSEAFIEPPVRSRRLETPLSDLVLRAELLDVLSSVRGATGRKRMTFRITRGEDGRIKVAHLNHAGADKLAALISDSALLHDQLEDATTDGTSVGVSVPLKKGVPIRSQLTISL